MIILLIFLRGCFVFGGGILFDGVLGNTFLPKRTKQFLDLTWLFLLIFWCEKAFDFCWLVFFFVG